jgi:glycosyltransferase involved in cell wall biosynthesis
MEPRVSFIVANYNYARYVGKAIDSLLSQTFRAIEVIVIDDCSTDDSRDVLKCYEADPRVRVIYHEQNKRNIATYNEGLVLARAEYVGLMGADDFALRPDAVERQVSVFDAHPEVGYVYSSHTYVDEVAAPFRLFQPWAADYVRDGLTEFRELLTKNYIPHSGTLVRRTAHDALGLYDPSLPHAGDWEMWLRLATRYRVGYIADSLYAYRIHGANLSVAGHSPRYANRQILLTLEKAFAALPMDAPPMLRAMRPSAIHHALLATTWGDRSLGRVSRAWIGLVDAALRSPSLIMTRMFYGAVARTALLSLMGEQRYAGLATWRRGSADVSGPALSSSTNLEPIAEAIGGPAR